MCPCLALEQELDRSSDTKRDARSAFDLRAAIGNDLAPGSADREKDVVELRTGDEGFDLPDRGLVLKHAHRRNMLCKVDCRIKLTELVQHGVVPADDGDPLAVEATVLEKIVGQIASRYDVERNPAKPCQSLQHAAVTSANRGSCIGGAELLGHFILKLAMQQDNMIDIWCHNK